MMKDVCERAIEVHQEGRKGKGRAGRKMEYEEGGKLRGVTGGGNI